MKLYYSPTSPYARKVRAAIREKGLQAQIDWRRGHNALAAWYEAFAARPSMAETAPS